MDLDRLKDDAGQAWKWMAEGWRTISDKAVNALTYFAPSGDTGEVAHPGSDVGVRWGLLAADVSEDGQHVVVELEAPGLDKEDIDVTVDNHRLIVTGTKRYESERKDGAMRITERAFGRFQRVIPMPEQVTEEGAQAKYKRGVLTIRVPKAAPPSARKINVVSG